MAGNAWNPDGIHDTTGGQAPTKAPVKGDFFANLVAHQHGEPAPVKAKPGPVKAPTPVRVPGGAALVPAGGSTTDALGRLFHYLVHPGVQLLKETANPPPNYVTFDGKRQPVQGGPVFNPATLAVSALLQAPSQLQAAHQQAVAIAHPSAQNPPSLGREVRGLGGGAFGVPFMAVGKDGEPIKATTQKTTPTAKTLPETVTEALKGAKNLRAQQEAGYSEERGRRFKAFGAALQENPTMAGAKAASAHLAGPLPKLHFAGFEQFDQPALDAMVKHIVDHPLLREGQQKQAIDALAAVKEGLVPTRGQISLLHTTFGPETTRNLLESVSMWRRYRALGYDALNIPRAVMASADLSAPFRQGLMVGVSHPVIFGKAFAPMLRSFASEDSYQGLLQSLHANPDFQAAQDGGVSFTEVGQKASSREEPFKSNLAERIPGAGHIIRASGRAYTAFLDKVRMDVYSHLAAEARAQGRDPLEDPHLNESISRFINSATGRGDLGALQKHAEGLNVLLFSPRLLKSRFDFINPFYYRSLDPFARKQALLAAGGLIGTMATVLGLAELAGAKVAKDPRSADFGKIRIGHTRIDIAGGFQQQIRLIAEAITQQTVSTTTGKTISFGRQGPGATSFADILSRFARSKSAPIPSTLWDLSTRSTGIGQPLTLQNLIVPRLTPLVGQDAVSVGQDTGSIPAGIGAYGLGMFGVGIQNYKPKQPKTRGSQNPWGGGGGGSGNPWKP